MRLLGRGGEGDRGVALVRPSLVDLLLGYITFPQQRFESLHRVPRELELRTRVIDLRRGGVGAGLLRCDLTPGETDLRFQCRDLGASLTYPQLERLGIDVDQRLVLL